MGIFFRAFFFFFFGSINNYTCIKPEKVGYIYYNIYMYIRTADFMLIPWVLKRVCIFFFFLTNLKLAILKQIPVIYLLFNLTEKNPLTLHIQYYNRTFCTLIQSNSELYFKISKIKRIIKIRHRSVFLILCIQVPNLIFALIWIQNKLIKTINFYRSMRLQPTTPEMICRSTGSKS